MLSEAERAELTAACSTMVGVLDRIATGDVQPTFAKRLSQEVAAFYAVVMSEIDAAEDLIEMTAEDFEHFPPNRKSHA